MKTTGLITRRRAIVAGLASVGGLIMARYPKHLPPTYGNLLRMGFTEGDVAGGGSDRLVDAIVAWGDPETVALRIRDHHAAGADHVCVQVITDDARTAPMAQWRELADALGR